jgi:hypothetical protein
MQMVYFLPPFIYGLHLAILGDWTLLVITSVSLGIGYLTDIKRLPSKIEAVPVGTPRPKPGEMLGIDGQPFRMPEQTRSEVVYVYASEEIAVSFFTALAVSIEEEVWLVGNGKLLQVEAMRSFDTRESRNLKSFMQDFNRRASISLPLNLFTHDLKLAREFLTENERGLAFRVFCSTVQRVDPGDSFIQVTAESGNLRARGKVGADSVDFFICAVSEPNELLEDSQDVRLGEIRQNGLIDVTGLLEERLARLGHNF